METNNVETKSASWFEVRVKYEKTQDNGEIKRVTELYTVNAMSFGEAEERMTKEMQDLTKGDFEIKAIAPANYKEIFFSKSKNEDVDKYYKAKLAFITIDEKTESEKQSKINYLVQAGSLEGAQRHVNEVMNCSMIDYISVSLSESGIVDVIDYE